MSDSIEDLLKRVLGKELPPAVVPAIEKEEEEEVLAPGYDEMMEKMMNKLDTELGGLSDVHKDFLHDFVVSVNGAAALLGAFVAIDCALNPEKKGTNEWKSACLSSAESQAQWAALSLKKLRSLQIQVSPPDEHGQVVVNITSHMKKKEGD